MEIHNKDLTIYKLRFVFCRWRFAILKKITPLIQEESQFNNED